MTLWVEPLPCCPVSLSLSAVLSSLQFTALRDRQSTLHPYFAGTQHRTKETSGRKGLLVSSAAACVSCFYNFQNFRARHTECSPHFDRVKENANPSKARVLTTDKLFLDLSR